jgi:NAD(P)-dependent dehydrogenase (short-subunit alcohol dehydrogenase family)
VSDLTGQVFVITGGNGGIDLGMASGLVTAGAQVCIWGRDEAKNETAVARLRALEQRGTVTALRCDVAEEAEVISSMGRVLERFGHLEGCKFKISALSSEDTGLAGSWVWAHR